MSIHDDQLDRFLDGLARGDGMPSELDVHSTAAARQLFRSAERIAPSQNFVNRLEAALAQGGQTPKVAPAARSASGRRSRRLARNWAGRAFGAAALAALAIVAMAVIYRSGPDEPMFAVASVAASPSTFPGAADCNRDPVPDLHGRGALSRAYGPALLKTILKVWRPAPAAPHPTIAIIPISELPSGAEPGAADRAAVEAAVRRDIACRNFGLYGWGGYASPGSVSSTPQVEGSATPIALRTSAAPLPAPLNPPMSQFADGRVAVLLPTDLEDTGLEAYAIFAPYQGEWFMTEYAAAASDSWLATGYRGAPVSDNVVVNLQDTYVWPTELAIPCCRQVTLTIVNQSRTAHTITTTDRTISASLEPGASKTIEVTLASGGNALTVDSEMRSQTPVGAHVWAVQATGTPAAETP